MRLANNCVFYVQCLHGPMCFIWKESILSQPWVPLRPELTSCKHLVDLLRPHMKKFADFAYTSVSCAQHLRISWTSFCTVSLITGVLNSRSWTSGSIFCGGHHETCSCFRFGYHFCEKVMQWLWYCNWLLSLWSFGFHVEDLIREYWMKQSVGPLLVLLCGPLSQRSWNISCTTWMAPTTILNSQLRLDNIVNFLPIHLCL